jgi:L-2-hydroxyglutarate oxidase LhgO|tara:strand:+ start:747 stop:1967 length:1221 start_codon:yes stop_codon:yes gene_type:complete
MLKESEYDIVIIGAGVIGSALANRLSKRFQVKIAIVEKEGSVGYHASSRNSGVIHSGFYYRPNSLKAKFCVEGNKQLQNYCVDNNIPYKKTGTLVVGKTKIDENNLEALLKRSKENNVQDGRIINEIELRKMEPFTDGKFALYSPMGSIVDSRKLVESLGFEAKENGVKILLNQKVISVKAKDSKIIITTSMTEISAKFVINCAGVYSDKIAKIMGLKLNYQIIPFRGEYFELPENKSHIVNSMIYPIPDPDLPFLGIHLTKTIENKVIVGPNAVLAPGKEAYRNKDVNFNELMEILSYGGFWKMLKNNRKRVEEEFIQSLMKTKLLEKVCDLVPKIELNELIKSYSGIRAQLVDDNGKLVDDLVVKEHENSIHILNAVSPGMTCSMPFADHIIENYVNKLNFKEK